VSASSRFRLVATPSYERDVRKLTKRHPKLLPVVLELLKVLETDPTNQARQHDIRKLKGVPPGEGQWRIRSGNYRLRYDVYKNEVELHSFTDRKEAY
jgi:mRNA-degrading endonuclease RelE of RelBE toxin-antitoxin system